MYLLVLGLAHVLVHSDVLDVLDVVAILSVSLGNTNNAAGQASKQAEKDCRIHLSIRDVTY